MRCKTRLMTLCLLMGLSFCTLAAKNGGKTAFFKVDGQELIAPDGKPFLLQGTNLGNWLNPEGYMFLFDKVSSYRLIDQAFKEMIGPDATNMFWRKFQDSYITREDIFYIKQTGMNSIRVPFHYKLFTSEDYMGFNNPERGFELLDRVIGWCGEAGLYVILDMHDAPGGQTGDNIDDSYGYPWLLESENDQQLFCNIWQKIAKRYAKNTTVIGYDLLNEPIAHYFTNKDELNKKLEPLYKRVTESIRKVDKNHIVLLGGAQWNGNFAVFNDWTFDNKMMYTCHRYWCDTLQSNIQDFVDFRKKVNRPIYMGETGENTDEWVGAFRKLLEKNNIGWHFWPYKKLPEKSGVMIIPKPQNWDLIVDYTRKDRSSFGAVRDNRPDQKLVRAALDELLENIKFKNNIKNQAYIKALGMQP
ncbi:MAG: glycoside hydrolase family 5 [Bacteroidetes bacterium]|nr:glycoside hydrolase family 5 [Bacteroidota bacterium]